MFRLYRDVFRKWEQKAKTSTEMWKWQRGIIVHPLSESEWSRSLFSMRKWSPRFFSSSTTSGWPAGGWRMSLESISDVWSVTEAGWWCLWSSLVLSVAFFIFDGVCSFWVSWVAKKGVLRGLPLWAWHRCWRTREVGFRFHVWLQGARCKIPSAILRCIDVDRLARSGHACLSQLQHHPSQLMPCSSVAKNSCKVGPGRNDMASHWRFASCRLSRASFLCTLFSRVFARSDMCKWPKRQGRHQADEPVVMQSIGSHHFWILRPRPRPQTRNRPDPHRANCWNHDTAGNRHHILGISWCEPDYNWLRCSVAHSVQNWAEYNIPISDDGEKMKNLDQIKRCFCLISVARKATNEHTTSEQEFPRSRVSEGPRQIRSTDNKHTMEPDVSDKITFCFPKYAEVSNYQSIAFPRVRGRSKTKGSHCSKCAEHHLTLLRVRGFSNWSSRWTKIEFLAEFAKRTRCGNGWRMKGCE